MTHDRMILINILSNYVRKTTKSTQKKCAQCAKCMGFTLQTTTQPLNRSAKLSTQSLPLGGLERRHLDQRRPRVVHLRGDAPRPGRRRMAATPRGARQLVAGGERRRSARRSQGKFKLFFFQNKFVNIIWFIRGVGVRFWCAFEVVVVCGNA